MKLFVSGFLLAVPFAGFAQGEIRGFRTQQLSDEFHAEGAALADFNKDGVQDVVYGPFWFEGPDFEKRHLVYKPDPFAVATYSNNFLVYADDLDGDGWDDVLVLGFPARKASTYWFKNPGEGGGDTFWKKFEVFDAVGNESPVWGDVTGDGKKEIVCSIGGQFGLVAPADWSKVEEAWAFTPIAPPKSTGGHFTHGLGFGDVNGDGRMDLLEKTGWWEQPAVEAGDGMWKKHAFPFAGFGGSQMFAYDFDGDGDNDVISSLHAHGYGFAWYEQVKGEGGGISFEQHLIMGERPEESRYGVAFSQLHGMSLADMDGDGVKDLVTGKRYFAHGGKDAGGKDPPVIYWFRTVRGEDGAVDFVPYLIHEDSGVGTDVTTGDVNGDGRMDVVIGNKKGCFVHLQTDEAVEAPKPVEAAPELERKDAGLFFEGESLRVLKRAGNVRPQDLKSFGAGAWSGDAQVWWTGSKPGDVVEFALPVAKAGKYRIGMGLTKAIDYGIVEFGLDGKKIAGPMDLYNDGVIRTGTVAIGGEVELEEGEHRLSVTITGANPKAKKGYMFGMDYVLLHEGDEAGLLEAGPKLRGPQAKNGGGRKPKVKEGNDLEAKPLSPDEELASFVLPEGFVVELVASEETGLPKPITAVFDDAGRMWSITATGYPRDRDAEIWKKPGKDKVVVFDKVLGKGPHTPRVFADGMVMPMGVLPHRGGALVLQGPEMLFLDDEDGDGKADAREVLIQGFGTQDTHTMPHQLVHMPGNWIYFSQGVLSSGVAVSKNGMRADFNKSVVARMRPDSGALEVISRGLNNVWCWAHTREGRVFIHEANDLGYSVIPYEQDSSYPSFFDRKVHPEAPVHPPTAQDLGLGGTGFSGLAISDDRSGGFPDPWHGVLFVANPITRRINTVKISRAENGVTHFEKLPDLVSTEDAHFRPIALTFGPDGCLYVTDWYNRIISHNEVDRNHPARDKTRGRIWRIRHQGQTRRDAADVAAATDRDLVGHLQADNTWEMRAAWHQIVERKAAGLAPELVKLVSDGKVGDDVRIHALWSLEGIGYFDSGLWKKLIADENANVRREAVRALTTLGVALEVGFDLIAELADETVSDVRYAVVRYFRDAPGALAAEHLAWLGRWKSDPNGSKETVRGWKGEYLALGGSYEAAFQDLLITMVEEKGTRPDVVANPGAEMNGVIAAHPRESADVLEKRRERIARVTELVAEAGAPDLANGKNLCQSLCMGCHSIGGVGLGFAPPLDGSNKREVEAIATAVFDPNVAVENLFRAYRVEKKDGGILEGFMAGQDREKITLKFAGGVAMEVPMEEVKRAGYVDGKSTMTGGLGDALTDGQLVDLIGYLRTVD